MMLAQPSDAVVTERRLALRTKLAWATGGLGTEALRQSRIAWLIYFYASTGGAHGTGRLPLVVVSVLFFAGRVIEAFTDTLIGFWSDRTSSRFGRRIPFMVLATPPMAMFAVLLFAPPLHAGMVMTGAYFFLILETFFFFNGLAGIPYEAMLPEIALTSEDRVSTSSWRVLFGVVGAAVGLVGSGLLISRVGYPLMALTLALLALVTRYVGVAGIWNSARRDTPPSPPSLRLAVRQTLGNRPLLIVMTSFVLFSTALSMVIGLLPFYVSGVLREPDNGTWSGILTAVGIGAMALAIPVFARLARRSSKQRAYLRAMLVAAAAFPILFFAGSLPGIAREAQALVAMVVVGIPLAGVYLFPGPIIADLCDLEARQLGLRREGVFFSAQAFINKLVEAFAPLFLGFILLLGDHPGNVLGIRLVGPVAGVLVLAGYGLVRFHERELDALS